jgi:hypothetical protein
MSPETTTDHYLMPVRELMDILTAHTRDARGDARERRARLRARLASEALATPRRPDLAEPSRSRGASSR